jgi:hypothetical protein
VRASRPSSALALVLGVVAVAGCKEVETSSSVGYEPVKLEEVKGQDDIKRVVFSAEGVRRTDLRTAAIAQREGRRVLPYAALLYDEEGETFVYAVTSPRSFLRRRVAVDRVDGDRVVLNAGPRAGTRVVTLGAAEVYGAEQEIAGGH